MKTNRFPNKDEDERDMCLTLNLFKTNNPSIEFHLNVKNQWKMKEKRRDRKDLEHNLLLPIVSIDIDEKEFL